MSIYISSTHPYLSITFIAQLIKTSEYVCTPYGQVPGSSLGCVSELTYNHSVSLAQEYAVQVGDHSQEGGENRRGHQGRSIHFYHPL